MVPFAGYDMPVQYEGILAEARAVRSAAGIFDVSHMGQVLPSKALTPAALLDWVHTGNIGEEDAHRPRALRPPLQGSPVASWTTLSSTGLARRAIHDSGQRRETPPGYSPGSRRWRAERFPNATLTDRTAEVAMIALQGPECNAHRCRGLRSSTPIGEPPVPRRWKPELMGALLLSSRAPAIPARTASRSCPPPRQRPRSGAR